MRYRDPLHSELEPSALVHLRLAADSTTRSGTETGSANEKVAVALELRATCDHVFCSVVCVVKAVRTRVLELMSNWKPIRGLRLASLPASDKFRIVEAEHQDRAILEVPFVGCSGGELT